jgi:hypothetical protein
VRVSQLINLSGVSLDSQGISLRNYNIVPPSESHLLFLRKKNGAGMASPGIRKVRFAEALSRRSSFCYFESSSLRYHMKIRPLRLLVTFVFLVTGHLPLSAQKMKDTVSLTIVVIDPSGSVIPDAQIKLSPAPLISPKNPETNEGGALSLDVVPGRYNLYVSSPNFVPWAKHIEVDPAPIHTVRVVLQLAETTSIVQNCSGPPIETNSAPQPPAVSAPQPTAFGLVTVVVTNATRAAVPYAQIEGLTPTNIQKSPEADEHGKFSTRVIPGNYNLAVTSPGFRRGTKSIRVKDGENLTVDIVLEAGGCSPEPCPAID